MGDQLPPERNETNLADYWKVLLKRRLLISIVFLAIVIPVAIYTLLATPLYLATAQILIEKAKPNILSSQELMIIDPSGTDFYQTQYQILESRSLARQVINDMNLGTYDDFKGLVKKRTDDVKKDTGQLAVNLSPGDASLVGAFLNKLKIDPVRNSRLVNINFESTDPKLAARIVNNLTQAYIDWNLGLRIRTQQTASKFLDDQVKESKQNLQASEQALQRYREKFGVTTSSASQSNKDIPGPQDISRQKLAQVNTQLVEAVNKRIEAEVSFKKARDLLQHPEQMDSIPEVLSNPVIIAIKNQEVQLLKERSEKMEKFGPKHPAMVGLNQEMENLKKKKLQEIKGIVEGLKSRYEIAQTREKALKEAFGQSQTETINRDKVAIQYQLLQQEVESNRGIFELLLKRLKESNIDEENRAVNIYVVDPAEEPQMPFKPRIVLNLLLSSLLGLFLGIGTAFFLEVWNRSGPPGRPNSLKNL
jgi:uncharacterized protein involved in exopolysaccharide biosynthesis